MSTPPTSEELRALGLDDASLDTAWEQWRARMRVRGLDPDALVAQASANLAHWREHPVTWESMTEADRKRALDWILYGDEPPEAP